MGKLRLKGVVFSVQHPHLLPPPPPPPLILCHRLVAHPPAASKKLLSFVIVDGKSQEGHDTRTCGSEGSTHNRFAIKVVPKQKILMLLLLPSRQWISSSASPSIDR
jgi:hypothetical protein